MFQVLFQQVRWKSNKKCKKESFRYFSNEYVGKVPKNGKIKVLGTFLYVGKVTNMKNKSFRYFSNGYVGKVPKNGKIKVLGTFPMGTFEKYLKMENESFRYLSNGYVEKVLKNGEKKFQVLFQCICWKST